MSYNNLDTKLQDNQDIIDNKDSEDTYQDGGGGYINNRKNYNEKTHPPHPPHPSKSSQPYENNTLKGRFDPDCINKARETNELSALELIIGWLKKKGVGDKQIFESAKTFLAVHNLNIEATELLEILSRAKPFTCETARELGFCVEECRLKLPPAERILFDTESVILFQSTSELDVKVAGRRKIIPLKKFFKKDKERGTAINPAIFDELFIESYYLPPNPPFSVDDAAKVYTEWLERAEYVKTPIDQESALEESILEIITGGKRDFFALNLYKEGKVPAKRGFFAENGIIYIESELFKELLEDYGIKERKEKVSKAVQRLLAGRNIRIQAKGERRYFWRFNLNAIQAIMRRDFGEEWQPVITETIEEAEIYEKIMESVNINDSEEVNDFDGDY